MPEETNAESPPHPVPVTSGAESAQSAATSVTNRIGEASINAATTSGLDAARSPPSSQGPPDKPACPPKQTTLVEIINCLVAVVTLCVLGLTLYVVHGQLNVYSGQLEQARQTASFNALTALRDNGISLTDRIYDPKSIFSIANATECHNMPTLTDQDHIEINRVFGHFEMYFDAWRLHLVGDDEWKSACQNAHKLLTYSCLLKNEWVNVLSNSIEPAFRDNFKPCVP
jgi:hypothetical protein